MTALYDMHCHLGFFDQPAEAAVYLAAHSVSCFSVTVTPHEYLRMVDVLKGHSNVQVGLGLHPWWLADGRCTVADVDLFERLAPGVAFIGEVGLDFSHGRAASKRLQIEAFERILDCIDVGAKVSIHAVAAYDDVLDAIECSGRAADCSCIFHRFAGSSDQLQRAVTMGCFISFDAHGLATKRGRAYAQVVPAGKMLLETDEPSSMGAGISYAALEDCLEAARCELRANVGADALSACNASSRALLGFTL